MASWVPPKKNKMSKPLKMGMYFALRKTKGSSVEGTMRIEFQGKGWAS